MTVQDWPCWGIDPAQYPIIDDDGRRHTNMNETNHLPSRVRAMGDASPVMSGRQSAADGKSCRQAPWAGTDRLPDRPVSPARLAPIDDVGSGIGAVNFAQQRYTPH
jgi:hypothetical protein